SPLEELPIQYADYAVWQRSWLQGEVLDTQLRYWKEKLDGVAVLELPTDRGRPVGADRRGSRERVGLSGEVTQKLRQMSQSEGVTLFMSLLAGFQILLARYSGQEDIAVGTPIAGRNRREIEGLIGFFVNTLVMRTKLDGDPSFREILGRVREVALGAYAHQEMPFEKLVEELQPERSLSHNPLFQVMFTLENAPRESLELSGLQLNSMKLDDGVEKFDLTLAMVESGGELAGVFSYSTDLFEAATIERMRGHFERLLEGAVSNPDLPLSRLPLLRPEEARLQLGAGNQTGRECPRDLCIHELFEAQVRRDPEATAVVFEKKEMSYRELNGRANQLARYLRELGVGPETRVGVCMERSFEMVIGLLGTLKAGGAYVPLDANYPEERLGYMGGDAEGGLCFTHTKFFAPAPRTHART